MAVTHGSHEERGANVRIVRGREGDTMQWKDGNTWRDVPIVKPEEAAAEVDRAGAASGAPTAHGGAPTAHGGATGK